MMVRVVKSFAANLGGEIAAWHVGRVAELPAGVNWVDLGWVVPVEAAAAPAADDKPAKARKPAKAKGSDGG